MKLHLVIAVCAGLLMSGMLQAGGMNINQQFSGVTHPLMVDTNDDGIFAGVASFQVVGSPGKGTILAVAEFADFVPDGSPGCDLRADLVQESFVETLNDGSMLFFEGTAGYNCVDFATGEVNAELSGIITGGTGRFEAATGTFVIVLSEAFGVGLTQSALTGTITGTID